jgi:hypothetical protein
VRNRIPAQLQAVKAKVSIGGRDSRPFVAIEKRVILNEACEESCRLGNRIFVASVGGGGTESGGDLRR